MTIQKTACMSQILFRYRLTLVDRFTRASSPFWELGTTNNLYLNYLGMSSCFHGMNYLIYPLNYLNHKLSADYALTVK